MTRIRLLARISAEVVDEFEIDILLPDAFLLGQRVFVFWNSISRDGKATEYKEIVVHVRPAGAT